MRNDGQHDFGYPCSMPETILVDGLFIDDSELTESDPEPVFIDYPEAPPVEEQPFPYQLTKRMETRSVTTASGQVPRISNNPVVTEAILKAE